MWVVEQSEGDVACTVRLATPLIPSLVAVIVTVPAATAVARPLALTVATAVLLLLHVTVRPGRAFPAASFGVAVNGCVAPTLTVAVAGVTCTEATGDIPPSPPPRPIWSPRSR